ncbi:hypothetical protein B0H14DRAFT_3516767 [Mycena olivaceomarginata]|nr:hypothetical protein B0H14DRAFT_3516767 [Mycena olivaceomarginata]
MLSTVQANWGLKPLGRGDTVADAEESGESAFRSPNSGAKNAHTLDWLNAKHRGCPT